MPKITGQGTKKQQSSTVKTGSGTSARPRKGIAISLNRTLVAVFIVVFGAIGSYLLFSSFADTNSCPKNMTTAECKASVAKKESSSTTSKTLKQPAQSPAKKAAPVSAPTKSTTGASSGNKTPAKQTPVASAPKSSGPVCLIVPGGHGKKCGSTTTCDPGYKLNGDICTQLVTCKPLATGHGEICSNGLISCDIGYNHAINPKQCTPIKCNSIANGNKCNGGRITCNPSYYSVNGGCSKISCQTEGHIIKCNNVSTISCVTGYTLVGSACKPVTCYPLKSGVIIMGKTCTDKTTTCYQNFTLKGAACVPVTCNQTVTNGTKCNDGTLKCLPNYQPNAAKSGCQEIVTCKTPASNGFKCSDGKYTCNSGYFAMASGCEKVTCQALKQGHGQSCKPNNTIHCDAGYFNLNLKGVCSKIQCGTLSNHHGTTCNDGTVHCEQGYTVDKSNNCITIKCTDILNGNGQTCNNGKILCGSFHYAQDGKCVDTQCRTVSHGINCTNGQPSGRTTCDTGFFDSRGECKLITCNTHITDGKSCNNGRLICANGYYQVGDKCRQITRKKINGGVKLSNGNINCNNGFKQSGSKCQRDNMIVVAYQGNNDGCGGTATHYAANKKTHVDQVNYGKDSVCVCSSGKTFAYGKSDTPMSDKHDASACAAAGNNRGKSSGNGGTNVQTGGQKKTTKTGSADNTCGDHGVNDSYFGSCVDPAAHNCGAHGQWKLGGASGCGCVDGYSGSACDVQKSGSSGSGGSNSVHSPAFCEANGGSFYNGSCHFKTTHPPSNTCTVAHATRCYSGGALKCQSGYHLQSQTPPLLTICTKAASSQRPISLECPPGVSKLACEING